MIRPRYVLYIPAVLFLLLAPVAPSYAQQAPVKPELVLQTGHAGAVNAVAFSPDGRLLASGGYDETIKLYDVGTRRELATFRGDLGPVVSVAFSPDGTLLASASGRSENRGGWGRITIWNLATRTILRTLPTGTSEGGTVAFSPDGALFASKTTDGLTLWDLATGERVRILFPLPHMVGYVFAFSPDGKLLAANGLRAERNGFVATLTLFNVQTGAPVDEVTANAGGSVAFSPDGKLLAFRGGESTVTLWELATKKLRSFKASHHVHKLAFSPDGQTLAVVTYKIIELWDLRTGRKDTLAGHQGNIKSLAFQPAGALLATGGEDGVRFWDGPKATATLTARMTNYVSALAFAPQGRSLASLEPGGVTLWSGTGSTRVQALSGSRVKDFRRIAFTPDGQFLVVTNTSDETLRYDLGEAKELPRLRDIFHGFASDGNIIAMTHTPYLRDIPKINIWYPRSGDKLRSLAAPQGHIYVPPDGRVTSYGAGWVALSPDGKVLGSGTIGGLRLLEAASGRLLHTFPEMKNNHGLPALFAFSPDSKTIAAPEPKAIMLWDVGSGRERVRLENSSDSSVFVHAIEFSADGGRVVVKTQGKIPGPDNPTLMSSMNTFRVWDARSGKAIFRLDSDDDTFAMSPDGRLLATGRLPGIRLWDVPAGNQVATLIQLDGKDDWLVVSPDGLFDGLPTTWGSVMWRLTEQTADVAPVEVFFNEFYYPGLLEDILAGKRPKAPKDISQLDRRQPQVRMSLVGGQSSPGTKVSSRTVTVKVEVTEAPPDKEKKAGSGARDVRLFRNGSLVKVWRGDVLQGKGKTILETTSPIVVGENRFTAYAFNRDNVKSTDAGLVIAGAENLKRQGTAYILAIGINQYANPGYDLRYAVADAQVFSEELKRQQTKLGTFPHIEVIPLFDKNATKANILTALQRLAGTETGMLPADAPAGLHKIKPAQPEDAVFVYFAGHGIADGARFYLLPHDLGYQGALSQLDDAGMKTIFAHGISDLDLEQAFEQVDAGRLLLVIDACNSGQALEAEEKRRGPMNSKGLAQLAYEKGMYILTAAQGYQAALEATQLGHGLLTYALVEEGLKTAAADTAPKDGQVVMREWLDYTTMRVPQLQTALMKEGRGRGREIAFVDGEEKIQDILKRSLQHPRVFYRREVEAQPLVIAIPEGK